MHNISKTRVEEWRRRTGIKKGKEMELKCEHRKEDATCKALGGEGKGGGRGGVSEGAMREAQFPHRNGTGTCKRGGQIPKLRDRTRKEIVCVSCYQAKRSDSW